jgi:hypothetical protein
MPDARCTRSLVCAIELSMHASIHSEPPESPGIPARNGLLLIYIVLSPVIGFLATVASRVASTDLTPAPRCQDHTTSPSASGTLVRSIIRVHRIPPRAGDVAQRPSIGTGRQKIYS